MAILALGREAFRAASGMPVPWSAPHALAHIDQHIEALDRVALVLGDVPRGVLLASAQQHPFSPTRYAMETIWWIAPEARGQAAGAMLDAYEAWAAERGCAFCQMAALVTFPHIERLYERRGYRRVETHFLKTI